MPTDMLTSILPMFDELPEELRGPAALLGLAVAVGSSVLTGVVCVLRFVANQPHEGADTLRLRAEATKNDAEAQRYRAEAAKIEAESSRDSVRDLREQVDRLERENDRLIAEGHVVLERLQVCQRTSTRLEAQFARLEERCRVLTEWVESRGGDVSVILGGRAS